jgi:hypothetical protein
MQLMKRVLTREDYLNRIKTTNYTKVNEALANEVNWGDSWAGRLVNSIRRKVGVKGGLRKIDGLTQRLKALFDQMVEESQINVPTTIKKTIETSYLLSELEDSIENKESVSQIISLIVDAQTQIRSSKVEDSEELIGNLEELKKYIESLDSGDEESEGGESEGGESEGEDLDSGEVKKSEKGGSSQQGGESSGWKSGEENMGTIKILRYLGEILKNKNSLKTSTESQSQKEESSFNITKIYNKIIDNINQTKKIDFNNDLFSYLKADEEIYKKFPSDVKFTIFEVSGDSIVYRRESGIVKIEGGKMLVNIPKWSNPKEGGTGWKGNPEKRALDINEKTIDMVSKYLVSKLNELESILKGGTFKLNPTEISFLKEAMVGSWVITKSNNKKWYKSRIGNVSQSGIGLETPPVAGQTETNISKFIRSGIVVKDKSKAQEIYSFLYDNGYDVLSKSGKSKNVSKVDNKINTDKNQPTDPIGAKVETNEGIYYMNNGGYLILEKTELGSGESNLNKAFDKLKREIRILESEEGGVSITSDFISTIIQDYKNNKEDRDLKTFWTTLKRSYGEEPDPNPLFESLETLKKNPGKVAKKIAKFAKRSLQFEKEDSEYNIYKTNGELGESLRLFNKEFLKLLSTDVESSSPSTQENKYVSGDKIKYKREDGRESQTTITRVEDDKVFFKSQVSGKEISIPLSSVVSKVDVNEHKILNYSRFRGVFEKVNYKSIENKWDEIFTQEILSKYDFDEREVQEIIEKGSQSDEIILRDFDPILEIVRLFQRAWRLHTGPIPSGRSGGKVSNSVFREYEYVGNGSPGTPDAPGGGPYRNIEMFDKWDSAVMDILSDNKYRTTIFSDKAKFSWEYDSDKEEATYTTTSKKEESTKKNKPLGKILLKFITDLNDDPRMYGGGRDGGGKIKEFLDSYFGIPSIKREDISFGDDSGINQNTSSDMKPPTDVKFIKKEIDSIRLESNMLLRYKKENKWIYLWYLGTYKSGSFDVFLQMNSIDGYYDSNTKINKTPGQKLEELNLLSKGSEIEKIQKNGTYKKWKMGGDGSGVGPDNIEITLEDLQVLSSDDNPYLDIKFTKLIKDYRLSDITLKDDDGISGEIDFDKIKK